MERLLTKYGHISYDMLRDELGAIPIEQFSTKRFIYAATVCFAKYLIGENLMDKSFLEKAKKLKPKRHLPPKRLTVKEADLIRLINTCKRPLDRLIVILLASTGLRATEACSLKIGDLDFEEDKIMVRIGKPGG